MLKTWNRSYSVLVFLASVGVAQMPLLCLAKTHSGSEIYSATVDDGTAEEIGAHCNIETNCAIPGLNKRPRTSHTSLAPRNEMKRLPPVVLNKPKIIPVSTPAVDAEPTLPQSKPAVVATAAQPALSGAQLSPTSEPDLLEPRFDNVPKDRVAEISERMIYSYEILKRFGRAYDYRTTKLSELKRILKDLERTNQTARK